MISRLRVLVVEDEPVRLRHWGDDQSSEAEVAGPFASVREARVLLPDSTAVGAAVIDVNLKDGKITPVFESLRARGIPTVAHTGGSVPDDVLRRHPDLTAPSKPVRPAPHSRAWPRQWQPRVDMNAGCDDATSLLRGTEASEEA